MDGYRPGNFDGGFSGPISAAEALRRSLNVPFVDLIERYGPGRFAAQLGGAGLWLQIPGNKVSAAIVLGGAGTTLEELVTAYNGLGARGEDSAAALSAVRIGCGSDWFALAFAGERLDSRRSSARRVRTRAIRCGGSAGK